ncbi:MAG: matrixin family metalloprotease [Sandaracinaceae bacterium]|nr:matrixin family metalloprotease [Sandaracinaceae bacterium]
MLAALLALAGAAPARAYEVKRASTGATVHWDVAQLDVHVGSGLVSGLSAADGQRVARRAARAWSGLDAPALVVSDIAAGAAYQPGAPGVQVIVQRPWPHAQGLLATTMTLWDASSGQLVDADVLINPAARLGVLPSDATGDPRWDLQALLTHELGHVLGLGETRADPLATMWPTLGAGETHQRTLRGDDRRGIATIYGGLDLTASPTGGCARASVSGRRVTPPWPAVLVVVLAGAAWALRRRRRALPLPFVAGFLFFFWIPASPAAPARPLDMARWAPFAGATAIGPATVEATRVDADGTFRTRVHVDGHALDLLGGCVGDLCQRFGEDALPVEGEALIVAPATGAWAHVRGPSAFGGWLGDGPALPLSRGAI